MNTLTIKQVPTELYKRLKQSAGLHRRSLNREAILCLERALGSHRFDPEEFLANARSLRKQLSKVFVAEKELRQAKNAGRP